jgi:hypothetical protein
MVEARDIQLIDLSEDDIGSGGGVEGTTSGPSSIKDGEEEKLDRNDGP